MPAPEISIIIPTRNRAAILRRCLRALEKQMAPHDRFEVIVVDDGSDDETPHVLREPYNLSLRFLSLHHQCANAARNRGAALAQSELLLFLGDDTLAAPEVVEAHLEAHAARSHVSVGVLGRITWLPSLLHQPFLRFLAEPDCAHQSSFTGFDPENVPVGRLYGSHHSVKRCFFEQHGGFDEYFTMPAFDDIEMEFRYRKSGFRLVYEARAQAFHDHPYTFTSYCERTRMVGRMSVRLYQKHPKSATLTGLWERLRMPVDEAEFQKKIARLEEAEVQLKRLPEDSEEFQIGYNELCKEWTQALLEAQSLGARETFQKETT